MSRVYFKCHAELFVVLESCLLLVVYFRMSLWVDQVKRASTELFPARSDGSVHSFDQGLWTNFIITMDCLRD